MPDVTGVFTDCTVTGELADACDVPNAHAGPFVLFLQTENEMNNLSENTQGTYSLHCTIEKN